MNTDDGERAWRVLGVLAAIVALLCVWAPTASAMIVHMPGGRFIGVAPRANVSPASIAGSVLASHSPVPSANGNLNYDGGPVLHSTAPYLIFWDPTGSGIPASSRNLITRYFTDVAADSGLATNVYGVDRQFTDAAGFADYQQTFGSGQVISDTQPFPARDVTNCPDVAATYPNCVTDAQLKTEITRLIAADGLPTDGASSAHELTANAPIYFIVTPGNTDVCTDASDCTDSVFCAYHSSYTDASNTVLYAAIPMFFDGASALQNPKACQDDNTSAVQEPNGDVADVALKYLSHEDNESITDPLGTAWIDNADGNEDGDNCNFYGPTVLPTSSQNPNAFAPTLGGSSTAGTLFDQSINGDHYYLQSEWSNGDGNCEMHPSAGAITPSFTASASTSPGTPVSFNPAASTSSQGYTSATWNFGDGSAPLFNTGAPVSVSHTFASFGSYRVSLELVDTKGNLATVTDQVDVGAQPTAAFTLAPVAPSGTSVRLDASGSADPNAGGSVVSYAWSFGDGTASGTGVNPTHAYANPGTYTVTLVVTDNFGAVSTAVSEQVTVGVIPAGAFTLSPAASAPGTMVSFDAGGSGDSNTAGSIASYSWNFGDGSVAGSGAAPSHVYASPGNYTVSLVVSDDSGRVSTAVTHTVAVLGPPSAAFSLTTATPLRGLPVTFDAGASSDPNAGGSIASYTWNFGDGSAAGSGATATHVYAAPGTYDVSMSVTDNLGLPPVTVAHDVTVLGAPTAAFSLVTAGPVAGLAVTLNAGASSDPNAGGSIATYSWSFGDGSAGSGRTARHTFKSRGTYTLRLTVTDGLGLSSSTSEVVVVLPAGRITSISATAIGGAPLLVVTASGPGVLTVGGKHYRIRKAGTTRVPIRLSHSQMRELVRLHRLRVKLKWVPVHGETMVTAETVTLKR